MMTNCININHNYIFKINTHLYLPEQQHAVKRCPKMLAKCNNESGSMCASILPMLLVFLSGGEKILNSGVCTPMRWYVSHIAV